MKYIDSIRDYDQLVSFIKGKKVVILPTFVNHEIHYIRNKPSLLFIKELSTLSEFVVGIDHPDLFSVPIERINELIPDEIWTTDQKQLLSILNHDNINDVSMLYYLLKNTTPEWILDSYVHLYYQRQFSQISNINRIIPATKHIEIHQENAAKILHILKNFTIPPSLSHYQSFLYSIYSLESTGLLVDPDLLQNFYGDKIKSHISSDNYVYSEYNFYTSAGRPSNRYGNINFAAIDKKTGVRRSFVPRYDYFILFDFYSFHFNLIAKFIKYEISGDIHGYLGQYYFGKDKLTKEEYEEAKILNFRYLYGGIPTEVRESIPYFAKVYDFTLDLWNKIKKNGFYKSPLTGRKLRLDHIDNPNPMKAFNYFIQLMEAETGMVIINQLQKYLEKFKTKLILYTYDSFLFDYSKDDGQECIIGIKKILDVFPTRAYCGHNYQDLDEVSATLIEKMK